MTTHLRLLLTGTVLAFAGCHTVPKNIAVDNPELVQLRDTLDKTQTEFALAKKKVAEAQAERLLRIAVANDVIKELAREAAVPESSRQKIFHQTKLIDPHVESAWLNPAFTALVTKQIAIVNPPAPVVAVTAAPAAADGTAPGAAAATPAASPAGDALARALETEKTDARAIDAKLLQANADVDATLAKIEQGVTKAETANKTHKDAVQKRFTAYETEITRLRERIDKFKKDQLDDEQIQIARYLRWTGIGMLVGGIAVIALTKGSQLVRGIIFCAGGGGLICAAILVSHPAFIWVLWSAVILAILGCAFWAYQEYFIGRVGDDVISAIEEVRTKFKTGTSDVNEVFETYAGDNDLPKARLNLRKNVLDAVLKEWVTEEDGTATYVDRRRRARRLL